MENTTSTIDLPRFPISWQWDIKIGALKADNTIKAMLGYPEETQFEDCHLFSRIKRNQLSSVKQALRQVLKDNKPQQIKFILYVHSSRYLGYLCIYPPQGQNSLLSGTFEYLMRLPSSQQESELMGQLFHSVKEGIVISDSEHNIVMANKVACDETGYKELDIIGEKTSIFSSESSDKEFFKQMWDKADESGVWRGELITKSQNGDDTPRVLTLYRIFLQSANQAYYLAISNPMENETSALSQNKEGESKSIIMDFKAFNNILAERRASLLTHQALVGITLDIQFKAKVPLSTRNWIIDKLLSPLTPDFMFASIKSNILAGCFLADQSAPDIHRKLEQIIDSLDKQASDVTKRFGISTNIGCSVLGVDARTEKQLISYASQALLASRTPGKNNIAYNDKRLQQAVNSRENLVKSVKHSLENNLIEVYYQPIIDIKTLQMVRIQGLLRIGNDGEQNSLIKEKVLIAEEYGLIDQFDNKVATKALSDLAVLQKHYKNQHLKLSFNRSITNNRTFAPPLEKTHEIINQSNQKHNLVAVEIDAKQLLDDDNVLDEQITKIKRSGVHIIANNISISGTALDLITFGIIDQIKISLNNEAEFTRNSQDYKMLQTIVTAARNFSCEVLIKGVDNTQTLKLIMQMGVDYVQGYIFGSPQKLETITQTPLTNFKAAFGDLITQNNNITANQIMNTTIPRVNMDDKLEMARNKFDTCQSDFLIVVESSKFKGLIFKSELNAALSSYLGTEAEQPRDLATLNKRVHQVMNKDITIIDSHASTSKVEISLRNAPKHILAVRGDNDICLGIITPLEIMDVLSA